MTEHDAEMNELLRGGGRHQAEDQPAPDDNGFDAGDRQSVPPPPLDMNTALRRAAGRRRGWAGIFDPDFTGDDAA